MNVRAIAMIATLGLGVAGCDETASSVGGTQNRNVTFYNQSGQLVMYLYGSNVSRPTWERDWLGTEVLPAGASVAINFEDGSNYCAFDIKIVFQDGDSFEDYNVNVCEISRYMIR